MGVEEKMHAYASGLTDDKGVATIKVVPFAGKTQVYKFVVYYSMVGKNYYKGTKFTVEAGKTYEVNLAL